MADPDDATVAFSFLADQVADPEAEWSFGTFGALAEFRRDADEPAHLTRSATSISAVTARGGIRLTARPDLRLVAFESTTKDGWSHRLALCLPEAACAMGRRAVLTEIGADHAALRPQDRDAVLFDLGLDAMQSDFCVRVADAEVAQRLRDCAGRPLFDPDSRALAILLAASPHRVFIGRLGRVEVFAPIPPQDGVSPTGPHTHVLPDLLRRRRTHAATEPIPAGYVPCGHLYPPHPAKDASGRPRSFDAQRHEAFQAMLRVYGDPQRLALKQQVLNAILRGCSPAAISLANDRFARTSVRVTLRQLLASEGPVRQLPAWMAAFDRPGSGGVDTPDAGASDPARHGPRSHMP